VASSSVPSLRFDDEGRRKASSRISRMFDRIAPTYDLLNHLLSANVDQAWRRRAVRLLDAGPAERVLDACTGTGDLAVALHQAGAGDVVGCDFAPEMIRLAEEKAGAHVRFQVADVLDLAFGDGTFDAATVAFGVRNFQDLPRGLAELCRVLRPGGRLLVLEFSRPPNRLVRGLYETYSMVVLPMIGNLVSGGADNAYAYLPRSVQAFPAPDRLAGLLREAGFSAVDVHPLTFGIATIHLAVK
jgi:demethylmenaquinone methyltransferase/2-methoxy-6-polyprenyl-1,4-benzoquinol methylase